MPGTPGILGMPGILGIPVIPEILGMGCFDGLGLCWNIWGGIRGVLCKHDKMHYSQVFPMP